MPKKIELECCVCETKFLKQLKHYVAATKDGQTEFYCSLACVSEGKKKFSDSPCLWCGKLCPHDKKFCNARCYGDSKLGVSGEKRSRESKNKLSLAQRVKSNNLPRPCENCGIMIERPKRKTQKYCSRNCCAIVNWNNPEYREKILLAGKGKQVGWAVRPKGKESFPEKFWREHLDALTDQEYDREYRIKKKEIGSEENGNYFLDFYFPSLTLDLEIDGRQHDDRKELDAKRDRLLKNFGIRVVRYKWPLGKDKFIVAYEQVRDFVQQMKILARFVQRIGRCVTNA